jgi:alpha-mannosidase
MPSFVPYTRRQLQAVLGAIRESIYDVVDQLEITAWRTPEPVPYAERTRGEELHLQVGDKWGDLFDCAWFRFRGRIPESVRGRAVVALLDVNGEMCVVDGEGTPVRGLTSVTSDFDETLGGPGKRVLPLATAARGGEQVEIWADAGCNDLFGNLQGNGAVKEACLAVCNPEVRALFYDYEVLLDSLTVLPEKSARYEHIVVALHDVAYLLNQVGPISDELAGRARERLAPVLGKRGGDPSLNISAIGHAHMDLAWLWPIRETKRKGARTFATALAQMDQYPDYLFAASQAQLFQWMKEDYPALYERIKARVKDGRLEPQGALWVESDTNLVAGEAFIRQMLYGRRFFREEFGVEVDYVWLPDTFGYTAALPQIMASAGIRYFLTQKLSWSLVNRFPHHSFHWRGIDGSQVLVHMLPEETYNSPAAPRSVGRIEADYLDKGISDRTLMVYGIGDGGGGPGEEHLERLARLENFAGLSPVKQEWSARFFEEWSKDAARFSTWDGELYLERHQGTLTTNARNKWYNRRMEQALREWEWLASLASLRNDGAPGLPYPAKLTPFGRLEAIWREALLYQFHDILPGSSIKRVYDETNERYPALLAEVESGIRDCQSALAARLDTSGAERPVVVFNSLSWERTEWLKPGGAWQQVAVPPMGYAVVDAERGGQPVEGLAATSDMLENDLLRVTFDVSGAVTSLYDKVARREVISEGWKANLLAVYRDLGDAWDFPMDYAQSEPRYMQLAGARARVEGPRAVLEQEYRLGHSTLTQEISLVLGRPYVEFATRATWRETQSMLRVSFPVAVHANEATFEIQFGNLRRPTHRNTTWDVARDEVAAHRWVDLSQRDYGVALLNDCKYGHKVKGNVIDLNLIRSVPYPGPQLVRDQDVQPGEPHHGFTDQTDHEFRYALYPHRGDHVTGRVAQTGYELNFPLRFVEPGPRHAGSTPEPSRKSFLQVDDPNVIVETVKAAENGEGLIVRLYEASGATVHATVSFSFPARNVTETDSMENPLRPLDLDGSKLNLDFRPFEIKTLRIHL